jgi:branched-chain amino acid transport system permease protein
MSESSAEQPIHLDTRGGDVHEVVGYRNKLRARWRALPERTRIVATLATQAVVTVLLLLWVIELGWAALIIFAIWWTRRLDGWHRLVLEAAIVVPLFFLQTSLGILLAIGFGLAWTPPRYRRWLLPVTVIALAFTYPFWVDNTFDIPIFGPFPDIPTAVVMIAFIMMAVGLNIVVGYAGLLDLGYVAFYAMGAYTAAWFASQQFAGQKCPKAGVSIADCPEALVPKHEFSFGGIGVPVGAGGFHISTWLLLLVAGALAAIAGILIGLPTLRLRGDYLAIVTLGFGEILPQIARNGDNLFGTGFNLTNGPNGITPIDPPGWGHFLSSHTGGFLPENYLACCQSTVLNHQISTQDLFFWTAMVLLLFTVFCSVRLRDSRLGRAWIAIREDETAAAAMGVPLMRTKTWAYASGAFFGGIAGAYYASFRSATFPGDFFFNISVFILCMVILGGMGSIWGVIVGAAFLSYLDRAGLANTGAWLNDHVTVFGRSPNIEVPLYASGIYGLIILLVMLLRPEGLIPSTRRKAELHEGVHDEYLYDVMHAPVE